MSTASLMKKLMEIDSACSPHRREREQIEREKNLDEFTIKKRKMASLIRDIREDIKERDSLYEDDDRKKAVEKGSEIRKKLKDAVEFAEELEKIQQTKQKNHKTKSQIPGFKLSEEKKAKDENREVLVGLMWKHLAELQKEEKSVKKPGKTRISDSDSVEDGEREVGGIPDLDDPRFEVLRQNDEEIDVLLDDTLQGVRRLKKIAQEIGGEVEKSNVLIEEIKERADVTIGRLETVNGQLKKTLEAARSPTDFCCDIILCCLILGIITAIYFVVTK